MGGLNESTVPEGVDRCKESPGAVQGSGYCIMVRDLHGEGHLTGVEFVAKRHSQPTLSLQQRN